MGAHTAASWGEALESFRLWAQATEGVELSPTRLSVAKPVREEFYARAAEVQQELAEVVLGERLREAEAVARALDGRHRSLCEGAGLARYGLAPRLEQFVDDVRGTAARPLQGLVTDAACGAVALAEVDACARDAARPALDTLVRCAYEAWAYLGIVAALAPRRFWAVAPDGDGAAQAVATDEVRAGWQVPSRELRFPEAVFETAAGDVFALKMECAREIDYYDALAPVARDTSAGGDTHEMLAHRVLLLYRLANAKAVGPVVDRRKKLQVPCDMAATVLSPKEMGNPAYLGAFIARTRKLRTRQPLQVLTFDEAARFPDAMAVDAEAPAVACHGVGLRDGGLAPVAALAARPINNPVSH